MNSNFHDGYQPYGQDNGTPYCSSTCENYKFTGKPYSTAVGLYYEYQRWYDPSIGRFISSDPLSGSLANPQSLNSYIYTTDNPASLTDPSGGAPIEFCVDTCSGPLKGTAGLLLVLAAWQYRPFGGGLECQDCGALWEAGYGSGWLGPALGIISFVGAVDYYWLLSKLGIIGPPTPDTGQLGDPKIITIGGGSQYNAPRSPGSKSTNTETPTPVSGHGSGESSLSVRRGFNQIQ